MPVATKVLGVNRPIAKASLIGAVLLAALGTGCAGDSVELFFVRPGRFDYLNCAEIAAAARSAATHEQDLKMLIDRAEKDAFGPLIATASYRSDYLRAQGELKLLAEARRNKNCPPETPSPQRAAPGR